jgi:hypothetical protein
VVTFLGTCKHPLSKRPLRELTVAGSMEALYDIQDTLLLGSDDEEDAS